MDEYEARQKRRLKVGRDLKRKKVEKIKTEAMEENFKSVVENASVNLGAT